MANRVQVTILEEGYRNVRVAVAGVLDTANLSAQTILTLANCVNNDPMAGTLVSFAIDRLEYAISGVLLVEIDWHATTNQLAAAITDSNDIWFTPASALQPQNVAAAGFNGTMEMQTWGWAGVVGFTVLLTLRKIYK